MSLDWSSLVLPSVDSSSVISLNWFYLLIVPLESELVPSRRTPLVPSPNWSVLLIGSLLDWSIGPLPGLITRLAG